MLDRRPELEHGIGKGEGRGDLLGQGVRLLGRQVATDPPVDDLRPFARREIDAIGEVAVVEAHPDAERLQDTPTRVLLAGVVPEDAEDPDVGLRRDAGPDRHHRAGPSAPRQPVEVGGGRRFQRGAPVERGVWVVAEPVEADVQEGVAHRRPFPCL
jgi:hypothetical protein